jgi:DNA-binding HxlR family transcriptional regulator
MKRLNTDLAKIVLHELSRQPLSRTELEKRTTVKAGTHAMFESTFSHLVYGGYIEKNSPKYRAKYVMTDKGLALLKALEEPKH